MKNSWWKGLYMRAVCWLKVAAKPLTKSAEKNTTKKCHTWCVYSVQLDVSGINARFRRQLPRSRRSDGARPYLGCGVGMSRRAITGAPGCRPPAVLRWRSGQLVATCGRAYRGIMRATHPMPDAASPERLTTTPTTMIVRRVLNILICGTR